MTQNKHIKVEDNDEDEDNESVLPSEVPFWTSSRLGLAVLGFFGFIFVYALRVNLSVAIVCMVNRTAIAANSNNSIDNFNKSAAVSIEGDCGRAPLNSTGPLVEDGDLNWDKTIQGLILGSFFWGYLVSQIPAGWLATRIGGKYVFGGAMLVASLLTLLTPVVAEHTYQGLIVIRILLGAASGITFPAMHCLWGAWAPPMERTKLMAFTYAGAQVGNIITFPLAGFLCKYGFGGGWPSIFYVIGGLSLLWVVAWFLLSSNTPAEHRRISEIERRYITRSLHTGHKENKKKNVPWKSIATSLPNYAIIVSNVTSDWGAYTLLTSIPTYINEVLKFDIASNGLVSALPYIGMWASMNFSGWISDLIRHRQILSTGATRKFMDVFGKLGAGALLVALGYVDCTQPVIAIALLVLGVTVAGFQYSGFLVNHVDIAPAYAGILFGISNSIAAVTGFLSPVVVGIITEEKQTRAEWQIVFYVAAAIYTVGAIFYAVFASGVLQPWATEKYTESLQVKDDTLLEDRSTTNSAQNGKGGLLLQRDQS